MEDLPIDEMRVIKDHGAFLVRCNEALVERVIMIKRIAENHKKIADLVKFAEEVRVVN